MTAGVATEVTRLMLGRPAGPARADGVPEEMVDTIEEFRSRLAALDWALTKGGALDEDVLTQVQHLCTATFSTFERHARGGGEHVAATAAYVTGETLPHLMQSGFMNRART